MLLFPSCQIAKHSLMKQDCLLKVKSWEEIYQLPHPPKTLHYIQTQWPNCDRGPHAWQHYTHGITLIYTHFPSREACVYEAK